MRIAILLLICLIGPFGAFGQLWVINLKCESQLNPSGIEEQAPSLSWQLTSSARNEMQTAYQIVVADTPEKLNAGKDLCWNSGRIAGHASVHIPYDGTPLVSARSYYWKVKSWDKSGKESAWSAVAFWQMGLLNKADWGNARWIALTSWTDSMRIAPGIHVPHNNPIFGKRKSGNHPLPVFRKSFEIRKNIKKATAFISGLGHYELSINGKKAGNAFLAPGWTNYDDYVYYNSLDVTRLLNGGQNAIGVLLGNGFYNVPNERYRKLLVAYGNPKVICKVLLEFSDGTQSEIVTDESWKATESPITFTSIYGGEDYDARKEQKGWNEAGFNDQNWKSPVVAKEEKLVSQVGYPMAVMDTFSVAKIAQPKPGVWVYDMGQNASAILQLTVSGKSGAVVKLTPGELITDLGDVNQSASGHPHFYQYTLQGAQSESWQPRFTYYGLRYIQIEGAVPEGEANPSGLPVVKGLRSLHVRNSAPETGHFQSSNVLFNRIYTLINWAVRSNIAHVVTDCPHREKLGWLEETYLMGNSIQLNYDMQLLNKKMFRDMESAQLTSGLIPDIVPEYVPFEGGFRDSPEWGSSGVILPWYTYQWYGEKRLLSDHYEMMKKYVDYLGTKANAHILMHGLGDWFDMGPGPMGESQLTPKGFTPTATYYYDVTILAKIAGILGKTEDKVKYEQLAPQIKSAFNSKFYDAQNKQYATGSQTANAMAIYLGLVNEVDRQSVFTNLVQSLKDHNYVLTAGDVGFHYLVKVLSEGGAADVLFKMNNRNDVPGYGYQLAHGATALTESWPALRNVSNNHLMLGHLMEWFYEGIGGIRQAEGSVGYQEIIIQPQFPGDLTNAETSYETPYGTIKTKWVKENGRVTLYTTIPVNVGAKVVLPFTDLSKVKEGGKSLSARKEIVLVVDALRVGSGNYVFSFAAP